MDLIEKDNKNSKGFKLEQMEYNAQGNFNPAHQFRSEKNQ